MEVDLEDNAVEMKSDISSESGDEENAELMKRATQLDSEITENVYNYEAHVELINALRTLVDLDKLRLARERMAKFFPLASNLWLDWLGDELKIATTPEEKKTVQELFERAVKDYLSVEVWLEYVQFSIGLQSDGDDSDLESVRKIFERALTAAGLHVSKGALLWEAYIEFEVVVLSMLQGKEAGASSSDAVKVQLKRIANLFRRQLSCPLFEMDETFETFNMWLVDNVGSLDSDVIDRDSVQNTFKKAKAKLSKIEKWETNMLSDISNFREYLDYEKSKEGLPARVLCLFERIVSELCLQPGIWLEYVNYVDSVLHDNKLAADVAKRGLRNCPWSGELAQLYLRILEKDSATHEQINEAVEECLSAGMMQGTGVRDVWLGYLEYMRRRFDTPDDVPKEELDKRLKEMRAAFDKALEHLSAVEGADPEYAVAQFYARMEFKIGKDFEKARQMWTDILADPQRRMASVWTEYINLEMGFGDSKHLRKLFPRALQQTCDWPEVVLSSWLNYERDEGTLESYMTCLAKGAAKMAEIKKERDDQEKKQQEETANQMPNREERRGKRPGLGFSRNENDRKPRKPTAEDTNSRKRPLGLQSTQGDSPEKKRKSEPTGDIVSKLLLLSESNKMGDHGVPVKHDHSKDNRTVFVSNLDYSTSEETIRELFSPDGHITDLRLVKDFKGRSKGYCYVEFENIEMAMQALKKDRHPIEGRPMFVSRCDPDSMTRGKAFRFATGIEKNKLFVKGLPFTTTEADLRELFGQYGILKDVRLVTFRNGHSKGLAYVDFEDEVSAKQAVLKADGMTLGDKEISVAISNPPERQQKSDGSALVASLGGGPKEMGPRGKGRTQLAFLPRSVQLGTSAVKGIEKMSLSSPQPQQ